MTLSADFRMAAEPKKTALVTGAGRGIGRAIALALGRSGLRVMVNDLNPDTSERTAGEIIAAGGEAIGYVADVANKHAVQAMINDLLERWERLDILINNAGVEPTASILTMDIWDWERTLAVNLTGTFLCSQSAGRVMKEQGGGVIVNISSIGGPAIPLRDRSAYCASKAGQVGFTRECAREFAAYGVRVNAVLPGVIQTEMTAHRRSDSAQMQRWLEDIPMGRLGEVEDVVGLVLFLCSDAAAYVTGQTIHVDGGKVMR